MHDYSQIPDCFYRVSIKALILDETGRFLLSREHDGRWDMPGGGLDHGESPRETLIRELREEMGIELDTMEDAPSYFVTAQNRHGFYLANIFYRTTVQSLDITPSKECQEVRFFTPEEAREMEIFPNIVAFCDQYKGIIG